MPHRRRCQVNASASLQHGFWSNDLVLTIGLSLVTGLDMRQFAGVLAHEFGHFAQGAGLRLTYLIRKINFWFARVVYERDEWDLKLERSARNTDFRVAVMLHMGRACVWLTRRILWALMQAGHAISCFMLRQMEYDADSYEAKIAGSDAFESTASRLQIMNVASHSAYEDLRRSWASNRLPDNLPLLIEHKANSLPAEVHQKLADSVASRKTRWFDTHPCDADREQMVQRLNQPGVFRLTEPAARLFSDFPELSRRVTRHQYEKQFSLQVTQQNLMSAEEMLRESAANTESDALVRKYFGSVNVSLLSLLTPTVATAPVEGKSAIEQWREARKATDTLRSEAEKLSAECVAHQRRLVTLTSAHRLAKAGFKLRPKEFDLPETATSAGEQETAARFALEETTRAISEKLAKLEPFMTALRQRLSMALRMDESGTTFSSPQSAGADAELRSLLVAVGAELPRAHEIGSKLSAFALLAQNRGNHPRPSDVDQAVLELVTELKSLLAGIQERLKEFAYPFPHARGQMSVADYLRSEQPAQNDWQRVFQDSQSHVERLFALNYQLIGRVLAQADTCEKSLEATSREGSKPAGGGKTPA